MNITSEIFQIGGEGFTSPSDAAAYLINFDGHAAIVDAGCGDRADRLIDNVLRHGVSPEQVAYLLITHCHFDHTGGIRAVTGYFSCPAVCHELDAVYLESGDSAATAATWYGASLEPLSVDIKLSGPRQILALGERTIEAIHVPGHSPGSVVYLVESDGNRVLFGQDVHGPLHPDFHSNQRDYANSLQKMLDLDADILCEGHYGIIKGKDEVTSFIQSFL
ncbi:MAG: MBL fold metallo-hydrolase [Desulfobacteraceae bacterium]|jgi:glyoxylase-like metal-dependent hydrolase (beta-lactamase superfamily II)